MLSVSEKGKRKTKRMLKTGFNDVRILNEAIEVKNSFKKYCRKLSLSISHFPEEN